MMIFLVRRANFLEIEDDRENFYFHSKIEVFPRNRGKLLFLGGKNIKIEVIFLS